MLAHLPSASRGSVGIQLFSSPSRYDQSGAWTEFAVVEFPIFHVPKNQSLSASMLASAKRPSLRDTPRESHAWSGAKLAAVSFCTDVDGFAVRLAI